MKKYLVVMLYNSNILPDVVGAFEELADAHAFARLSNMAKPDRSHVVAEVKYSPD